MNQPKTDIRCELNVCCMSPVQEFFVVAIKYLDVAKNFSAPSAPFFRDLARSVFGSSSPAVGVPGARARGNFDS